MWAISVSQTAGGQRIISNPEIFSTPSRIAVDKTTASEKLVYIFQFAITSGRRINQTPNMEPLQLIIIQYRLCNLRGPFP